MYDQITWPVARVEREHAAVGPDVVEHAVGHERERLQAAGGAARRMHPGDLEVLDVVGVDLVEAAVVPGLVAAVIGQPVVRGLLGIQRRGVLRARL